MVRFEASEWASQVVLWLAWGQYYGPWKCGHGRGGRKSQGQCAKEAKFARGAAEEGEYGTAQSGFLSEEGFGMLRLEEIWSSVYKTGNKVHKLERDSS